MPCSHFTRFLIGRAPVRVTQLRFRSTLLEQDGPALALWAAEQQCHCWPRATAGVQEIFLEPIFILNPVVPPMPCPWMPAFWSSGHPPHESPLEAGHCGGLPRLAAARGMHYHVFGWAMADLRLGEGEAPAAAAQTRCSAQQGLYTCSFL
jgi:hypothetical protein